MIDIFKQKETQSEGQIKPIPNVMQLLSKVMVIGFMFTAFIGLYAYYVSASALNGLIVIGSFGFLPIGIVLGGVLIDTRLRCKVLRSLTKRNLGIVNFISGNESFSRIKDIDNDVLETKTRLYFLRKGRVYNDKGEVEHQIDSNAIKFTSGIPTINFDINNALPLSFHEEKSTIIDPGVIAGIIKAHVIIKEAEAMNISKKQLGVSVLVLIGLIGANLYYSYSMDSNIKEILIPLVQNAIERLSPTVVAGG